MDEHYAQSRFHLGRMFNSIYKHLEAEKHFSKLILDFKPSKFVK